jgi:hypothetical protein
LGDATSLEAVVAVYERITWESPRTWNVLLTRLAAPGQATVSSRVRVRVRAPSSRPASAARMSRKSTRSAVEIHTPLAGQRFASAESVRLAGAAYTSGLARVSDRDLSWWVNGRRLARAGDATVAGLPPGRDTLELRARDGGRARVTVHVAVSPPAFVELDAPARISRDARRLVLRVSSVLPAALRVSGGRGIVRTSVSRAVRRIVVRVRPGRSALRLTLSLRAGRRRSSSVVIVRR